LKKTTGLEEEQAVRVVGNSRGGTKRVWNPATKYGLTATARAEVAAVQGCGFLDFGAPEGRQTPREKGREQGNGGRSPMPSERTRIAEEVLEGE
jgi:hypothetical protein